MRILVTGGAGYIGSHTVRELRRLGHDVVVLDDLSEGHRRAVDASAKFYEGNAGDSSVVVPILKSERIEAVFHLAGSIEVEESVKRPEKYFRNNFETTKSLLESLRVAGVSRLVFASTSAVYGNPDRLPVEESDPCQPISPYGVSKLKSESAIVEEGRAHGLSYAIIRYCNVAGAWPDGSIGEDRTPETHLIPSLLKSTSNGRVVEVFGSDYPTKDGSCVRDFVHVMDVVRANVLALEAMRPGEGEIYNVGSERGFSVNEVVSVCRRVTGVDFTVVNRPRRAGDPAKLVASSARMKAIGWRPEYGDLDTIVRHAWAWHRSHPNGYGD